MSKEFKFHYNLTRITDTLHEEIHILCSKNIFRKSSLYEIMWKNMVQIDRPQMTILYDTAKTRFACRIAEAGVGTHS